MILYLFIAIFTVAVAALVRVVPEYTVPADGACSMRTGIRKGAETEGPVSGRRAVVCPRGVWSRRQACNTVCLTALFLILFALSACRVNVGNDYAKYVEFMHLIACDAYDYVPTEIGFNALVKVLYGLSGYENFLLVFAVFAFLTLFLFLKAMYGQSDSFGYSFFLFMTFGFYFQTYNTVRYYLALAIALYSIKYVLKREWVKFVLLVLLGAAFHKSLLVVLPLYFLASLPWKKWQLGLAALFCTTFFFLQDFYLKLVVFLYPSYEDTEYLEGGVSWFNILRCTAVLVFSLLYYKQAVKESRRNRFYFYCNLGALVLYVCCSFLPIVTRIGYYLNITQILFIPAILQKIPDKRQKWFFRIVISAAAAGYFALFLLRADNDGIRVLPYQTFMFHDMVTILSDMN